MGTGVANPGLLDVPYIGRSVYDAEGGYVVFFKAGAAIALNDVVMIDTTADDQVIKATSANQDLVVGVCVGRIAAAGWASGIPPAAPPDWAAGPSSGQVAIVQVDGVVRVVSGGAISRGDKLVPDTTTSGRVMTGTVFVEPDVHIVGKALQAATGAGQNIRCKLIS